MNWLQIALTELADGVREVAGPGDNLRIVEYHKSTTLPEALATQDETAWCASFIGWCLEQAEIAGTKSARAKSYLPWGQPLAEPRFGAVAVLSRPPSIENGHVGFFINAKPGLVYLLGGNQGDRVSIAKYAAFRVLAYRWPEGVS